MKKIVLTGDRPTGKLHLGHYIGSLKNRVALQDEVEEMYIEIADFQALTDNFSNPQKVSDNVLNLMLDYLSIGIDPEKVTIFVQTQIPELYELTCYYLNIVKLGRLEGNPTVKNEMRQKGFEKSIPVGFLVYPVSQAADITLFDANTVPVGVDQLPMIEQTNDIVKTFNTLYGNRKDIVRRCNAVIPENKMSQRLPGIDGNAKMSKSLNNCIYLADSKEEVAKKVMKMYTDPDHIRVEDPGKVEGNMVFTYLDVFATDEQIAKYMEGFNTLEELKQGYQKGGIGDVKIKKVLINVLEDELEPIREKRKYYEENMDLVKKYLEEGTKKAKSKAKEKIIEIRKAVGVDYNF